MLPNSFECPAGGFFRVPDFTIFHSFQMCFLKSCQTLPNIFSQTAKPNKYHCCFHQHVVCQYVSLNPFAADLAVAIVQLSVRNDNSNGVCVPLNKNNFIYKVMLIWIWTLIWLNCPVVRLEIIQTVFACLQTKTIICLF